MTIDDHQGFLQAILDEPETPEHALIYADWLEEHVSYLRAQRIRLQVEAERIQPRLPLTDGGPPAGPWLALKRQKAELDQADCRPLRKEPRKGHGWTWGSRYDGLARRVHVRQIKPFLAHLPWQHYAEPVCRLDLQVPHSHDMLALADLPQSGHLTDLRLTLRDWIGASRTLDLAKMFPKLDGLLLEGRGAADHMKELMGLIAQGRWKRLRLAHLDQVDWPVAELAEMESLSQLEELALPSTGLTDTNLLALIGSPHLSRLRILDLSGNHLRRRGMRMLAESKAWPRLRQLILNANQIDGRAAAALSHWSRLPQLDWIDLRENPQIGQLARRLFDEHRVTFSEPWRETGS